MRATTRFPHARTTAFVLLTLAWAGAIPAPAATVDKLPDFISKVQLHNCGGVELTEDGKGVMLYRLPKEVRDKLDMKTPDGKERSGATQMRAAVHSEIRFVLNDGAKLSDVKLHIKSEKGATLIEKLASTHPKAPIVCISLFPYGTGDLWKNARAAEYRKALEEICKASAHKNVHFVSGPDLLSFTGLSEDLLHPSDHGMIEIATKLAPRIRTILDQRNP